MNDHQYNRTKGSHEATIDKATTWMETDTRRSCVTIRDNCGHHLPV